MVASMIDENSLIDGLVAGTDSAYKQLIMVYYVKMHNISSRLVSDRELAKDCVQDALISIYKNIGSFPRTAKLSTWIYKITVNASLAKLRTQNRKVVSIEDLLPKFDDTGHREEAQFECPIKFEDTLQQNQTAKIVRELIDRLPDNYRNVILLRDIEELSTIEVAEIMGLSEANIKTSLHRARSALKKLIENTIQKEAI
jgi:RNA polymerase sigma-70 factor (ECF subfamily)